MRIQIPGAPTRGRLIFWLASALALLGVVAVAVPPGTVAEEASEPLTAAAAEVDAGGHHSCGIFPGGGIRCWGYSNEGQLGLGNRQTIGDDETPGVAPPVYLDTGRAVSISAGDFHTCARLENGDVRCWGFGFDGRLGHQPDPNDPRAQNVGDDENPGSIDPVDLGGPATAIAAGGSHSCAIFEAGGAGGKVRCWGYGERGALGYGEGDPNDETIPRAQRPPNVGDDEPPSSKAPVNFGGERYAKAITAGFGHTCAILDDDTVRCWGLGSSGQLGYGETRSVADPSEKPAGVNLGQGRTAKAISAGAFHTCAVLDTGDVSCWGLGFEGRLGYGNTKAVGTVQPPAAEQPLDLGPAAVAISAGDYHTCARLEDGSLRCWGLGASGRLGYGDVRTIGDDERVSATTVSPVNLGSGLGALAVSAGGSHTCARLDDGGVKCWGRGGNGRLGYCNERNVGDNEVPATVGPVPVEAAFRAPSSGYAGCARPPAGGGGSVGSAPPAQGATPPSPLEQEALRRRDLRSCLGKATAHAKREIRKARRSSRGARARLRRHIKRHRAQKRRACLKRHGRTPGRVTGLTARAASRGTVTLAFRAPGTDGTRPPAARTYVVKQSRRPIRSRRAFRRAKTLCKGRCRFSTVTQVGGQITLTVGDLRRRATYYYAVAARDNVSGRLGPRSRAVRVRTR